jgi:hypothetical protein
LGYQTKWNTITALNSLKTTDRNDQSTLYTIDAVGRPATIRAPTKLQVANRTRLYYDYFPTAKYRMRKLKYDPE